MYPIEKTAIQVPMKVTANNMMADSGSSESPAFTLMGPIANQVHVELSNTADRSGSANISVTATTHERLAPRTHGQWLRSRYFRPISAVNSAPSNGSNGTAQRSWSASSMSALLRPDWF